MKKQPSAVFSGQSHDCVPLVHRIIALVVIALAPIPHLFVQQLSFLSGEVPCPGVFLEASSQFIFSQLLCFQDYLCVAADGWPCFETVFQFFSRLHCFLDVLFEVLRRCQKVFFPLVDICRAFEPDRSFLFSPTGVAAS